MKKLLNDAFLRMYPHYQATRDCISPPVLHICSLIYHWHNTS